MMTDTPTQMNSDENDKEYLTYIRDKEAERAFGERLESIECHLKGRLDELLKGFDKDLRAARDEREKTIREEDLREFQNLVTGSVEQWVDTNKPDIERRISKQFFAFVRTYLSRPIQVSIFKNFGFRLPKSVSFAIRNLTLTFNFAFKIAISIGITFTIYLFDKVAFDLAGTKAASEAIANGVSKVDEEVAALLADFTADRVIEDIKKGIPVNVKITYPKDFDTYQDDVLKGLGLGPGQTSNNQLLKRINTGLPTLATGVDISILKSAVETNLRTIVTTYDSLRRSMDIQHGAGFGKIGLQLNEIHEALNKASDGKTLRDVITQLETLRKDLTKLIGEPADGSLAKSIATLLKDSGDLAPLRRCFAKGTDIETVAATCPWLTVGKGDGQGLPQRQLERLFDGLRFRPTLYLPNDAVMEPIERALYELRSLTEFYLVSRSPEFLGVNLMRTHPGVGEGVPYVGCIRISNTAFPKSGQMDFSEPWQTYLRDVGKILMETPYSVSIVGHADKARVTLPKMDNCGLSRVRAENTRVWLTDNNKRALHVEEVVSYGNQLLASPERGQIGRTRNRRVEIYFSSSADAVKSVVEANSCFDLGLAQDLPPPHKPKARPCRTD